MPPNADRWSQYNYEAMAYAHDQRTYDRLTLEHTVMDRSEGANGVTTFEFIIGPCHAVLNDAEAERLARRMAALTGITRKALVEQRRRLT